MASLRNLTSVSGTLTLSNHPLLVNLDDLSNLRTVGWDLIITDNVALPQCEACGLEGAIRDVGNPHDNWLGTFTRKKIPQRPCS